MTKLSGESASNVRATLASLAAVGSTKGINKFATVPKPKKGERATIVLTDEGTRIDQQYHQTFRLAEEKGPKDRDVVSAMASMTAEWSSYPGVIENLINEQIERSEPENAVAIAQEAASAWAKLLSEAGVKEPDGIDHAAGSTHLIVQVLANFEFALERAGSLERALEIARLAIAIDPSDPENLVSAIVGLTIRTKKPELALAELDKMPDSVAPFVLYGRALAFYALQQFENAATAVQTALRYWPAVAQGIGRQWTSGTPMPKPGEQVSEVQVLYGYFEVFGAAWESVEGAVEWLRTEEKKFIQSGGRREQFVGLTKSGHKADAHGNLLTTAQPNDERLTSAKTVAEDAWCKLLLVGDREYVYALKEAGDAQEAALQAIFKQDLKYHDRLKKLEALTEAWPGHANAAIALARFAVGERKFERAVDRLQTAIFALQTLWPDDLVGSGRMEIDWEGNKPILNAYAHIVLDCAEAGERDAARAFAEDYLAINPKDNLGVGQKAIELALLDHDFSGALQLIENAKDPIAAHNLFGRALTLFAADRKDEATTALHAAIQSRPKIYREFLSDKHRMPPNYNPTFVAYFSNEEAYNYYTIWNNLWRNTLGATAWIKREGKLVREAITTS